MSGPDVFQTRLPNTPDWGSPRLVAFERAHLLHRDASLAQVIASARGWLCYLATPYSKVAVGKDGEWSRKESLGCAIRAARWSRRLALEGVTAVSPILQAAVMLHVDWLDPKLDPLDDRFWEGWCRPLLAASGVVIVPPIAGWAESAGVWVEVCQALRTNRRVYLIRTGEEFGGTA